MLNLIIASTYLHKGWWWWWWWWWWITYTSTYWKSTGMAFQTYAALPQFRRGATSRLHGTCLYACHRVCVSWLWEPNKLQYITVKALSIDVRVSCFQDQIGRTLSEGQAKDLMWTPVAWHVEKYDGRCWKLLAHLTLALRFVVWFEVGCFHFGHPSTLGASGCHRDKHRTSRQKCHIYQFPYICGWHGQQNSTASGEDQGGGGMGLHEWTSN